MKNLLRRLRVSQSIIPAQHNKAVKDKIKLQISIRKILSNYLVIVKLSVPTSCLCLYTNLDYWHEKAVIFQDELEKTLRTREKIEKKQEYNFFLSVFFSDGSS